MNVDDYRKAYAAELEKQKQSGATSEFTTMSAAGPSGSTPSSAPDAIAGEIGFFRDPTQTADARLAALRNVQTATFMGPGFDRYRSAFRDALRAVATNDSDQKLRAAALELLAMDKDEVARQLLVRGIDDVHHAIVPLAKAIQLLAFDDHGPIITVARKIMGGNFDVDAKEEALRALASDPGADHIFAGILSDRSQPKQLRSISASGLRAVSPQRFEQVARSIVLNENEDSDVRAECLGALNHLRGYAAKVDQGFADALSNLDLTGKSAGLRAAAERFLRRKLD